MNASKNYTVAANVTAADEPAIEALLAKHPLWKRRHARECVARANFQKRITEAAGNVLKPGVLYSTSFGSVLCAKCAGATARTGRDTAGVRLHRWTATDVAEWGNLTNGKPARCEKGCTEVPQPATV